AVEQHRARPRTLRHAGRAAGERLVSDPLDRPGAGPRALRRGRPAGNREDSRTAARPDLRSHLGGGDAGARPSGAHRAHDPRRAPFFARTAAGERGPLADLAHTVAMTQGTPLFPASAPPTLWLVMAGEVVLAAAAGGAPAVARAGDTIGWYSTMSGRSLDRAA